MAKKAAPKKTKQVWVVARYTGGAPQSLVIYSIWTTAAKAEAALDKYRDQKLPYILYAFVTGIELDRDAFSKSDK